MSRPDSRVDPDEAEQGHDSVPSPRSLADEQRTDRKKIEALTERLNGIDRAEIDRLKATITETKLKDEALKARAYGLGERAATALGFAVLGYFGARLERCAPSYPPSVIVPGTAAPTTPAPTVVIQTPQPQQTVILQAAPAPTSSASARSPKP